MAVQAGVLSTINIGGTSTAMVAEATSLFSGAGANTVRQITDAAKRCLDPAVTVVVKDGGGAVASTNYTLDLLYGKIIFAGYTPSGAITVDANYIPLLAVAGVQSVNAKIGRQLLDATVVSQGVSPAGETFILGKKQASGEIVYLENVALDHDSGGGTKKFWDMLLSDGVCLLDVQEGDTSTPRGFRAWVVLKDLPSEFDHNGLVNTRISWSVSRKSHDAATISYAENTFA